MAIDSAGFDSTISSSTLASGIDDICDLLKLLYFQRDRGDITLIFLYGDEDDCWTCWKRRRFVNDLGEPLRSSICTGVIFSAACLSFNCSTADGFCIGIIFLLVAFKSNFLKSFSDVFGEPKRSLHMVDFGLL